MILKLSKKYTILFLLLMVWSDVHAGCGDIIKHYLKVHPSKDWDYDWTTAIFLYGALRYSEKHPEEGLMDIQVLFSELEKKIPDVTTPDLASMSLGALEGEHHFKAHSEKILAATQAYYASEPLNTIGAYDHVGKRHHFFWFLPATHHFMPSSIWADSLVMYVLNGYRLSKYRGNAERADFFLKQIFLFDRYLRDPVVNLYKHAYFVESKSTVPKNYFWGRGNMWVSLALIDVISLLKEDHPEREKLISLFKSHLNAVLSYVDQARGVRTLINDPSEDSYFEMSATALLSYVLLKGHRLGILEKKDRLMGENMFTVAMGYEKDGSISGISGPTTALKYPWYYTHLVGLVKDESYGVGSYLLMCSEI